MAVVTTIHGLMDEELLEKRIGSEENDNEIINWTEYWLNGELVHRSVHLHLKESCTLFSDVASLG